MQARPAAEPRPAQHPSSGPSSGHRDGTTTALPAHRPRDQNAEPEARCPLTATPRGVSANKQRRAIEPEAARGQGHSVDRTRRMTDSNEAMSLLVTKVPDCGERSLGSGGTPAVDRNKRTLCANSSSLR
jgi:hypothetical protein